MRNLLAPLFLIILFSACENQNSSQQVEQVDSLRYAFIAQENWVFHPVFDSLLFWQNQWMMQQNTWSTVLDSTQQQQLKFEFPNYFALGENISQLLIQHQTLKTIYEVEIANLSSMHSAIVNNATQDAEGKPIDKNYWENCIKKQSLHQDSLIKIIDAQLQSAHVWVEQTKLMYPLFQEKIKGGETK